MQIKNRTVFGKIIAKKIKYLKIYIVELHIILCSSIVYEGSGIIRLHKTTYTKHLMYCDLP